MIQKKKKACLILLKRKITNRSMLPTTTQFSPFPLYTQINTVKLAPNGNSAHSLGNANTWINNPNYANMNLRVTICFKKLKELVLTGLSVSRHYSNASGLVSSFLQARKKACDCFESWSIRVLPFPFKGLVASRTSKARLTPVIPHPSVQKDGTNAWRSCALQVAGWRIERGKSSASRGGE